MAGHTILSCEAICYAGAAYQHDLGPRPARRCNSIYAAGVNHGDDPRVRVRRRAGRHLAGLRRVLAVLQRRRRVRRRLGAAHAAVAAHPRRVRLPRPHPAGAADRHAALRHRLPAPEGLDLHRHRRSVGDQQRHPGRLDPLLRDPGAARPAPREGAARPARPGRPGVQGDDHRPDQFRGAERDDGRLRRPSGSWSSAAPGCRSSSSATGPRPSRSGSRSRGRPTGCASLVAQIRALSTTRTVAVDTEIPAALADLGHHPRRPSTTAPR